MILSYKIRNSRAGQSLVEVIIGLAIGALLIGAAVFAISFMLRSSSANQKFQVASGLNQETIDKVRVVVSADWNDIYTLNKGEGNFYHVNVQGNNLTIEDADPLDIIIIEGVSYSTYFYVEDVGRNVSGDIVSSGGTDDPSTQKITVITTWTNIGGGMSEVKLVDYITRWQNTVFHQTDWVGGLDGGRLPIEAPDDKFANSDNVDSSNSGLIKLQGF